MKEYLLAFVVACIFVSVTGFSLVTLMAPQGHESRWCRRSDMTMVGTSCEGSLVQSFKRNDPIPDWLEKTTGGYVGKFARPVDVYLARDGYYYVFPIDYDDTAVLEFTCENGGDTCDNGKVRGQGKGVRIDWNQPGA